MEHGGGRGGSAAVLATIVVAGGAVGCSAEHVDKAGGSAPAKSAVLTLAAHDSDYAVANFAAEVARLSGGSMRIRLATDWRSSNDPSGIDYERALVDDVRSGRVPLGIVGVRLWDTLGLPSFRALVAPFLIESIGLEARALEGEAAARALATVKRQGVVGIALLPGFLRRPLGLTRPLVRPSDYRGATVGVIRGGVATATFRALKAAPRRYVPGKLSGLDGVELDLLTITSNVYDRGARALTGNVVLWPKPQTIVMNRAAFDTLTPEQQRIVRRAGRAALVPELGRDREEERRSGSLICTDGLVPVATAMRADRAALRKAVEPVYQMLERDRATKAWIAQIQRIKATTQAGTDAVRCP